MRKAVLLIASICLLFSSAGWAATRVVFEKVNASLVPLDGLVDVEERAGERIAPDGVVLLASTKEGDPTAVQLTRVEGDYEATRSMLFEKLIAPLNLENRREEVLTIDGKRAVIVTGDIRMEEIPMRVSILIMGDAKSTLHTTGMSPASKKNAFEQLRAMWTSVVFPAK